MGGHVILETGSGSDAGDHGVSASWAQAPAALVEEQRRGVGRGWPVPPFL